MNESDSPRNAHTRFADRVQHYIRYRPGYPSEAVAAIEPFVRLNPDTIVADVGSGTGKSAQLFLNRGCRVFAVEPNSVMRDAADRLLGHDSNYIGIEGTAEATTLPDQSCDLVIAGQAFHWFDPHVARREFERILRHCGYVTILFNARKTDSTRFLRDYEALLVQYGTDYDEVNHERIQHPELADFFGGPYETRVFPNEQVFDYEGLEGRLLSSSYVPSKGEPNHEEMLVRLREIFESEQRAEHVRITYDTQLYIGRLAPNSGT